jgi:hypothetical protein
MTKRLSNAEHICVLVNEGEGYCSAPSPFLQRLAEDEGYSRTLEAAGFQAPALFFDKMGRCHSPFRMDRGQSNSYEEVHKDFPQGCAVNEDGSTFKDHSMSDDEMGICFQLVSGVCFHTAPESQCRMMCVLILLLAIVF